MATILALLLGFSPLQGAVAAVLATPAQGMGMHQMVEKADDKKSVSAHQMKHECQQHQADNGCTNHAGSSGHCASCVIAILPDTTSSFTPTVTLASRPSNVGFTSQYTTSPYRPPIG